MSPLSEICNFFLFLSFFNDASSSSKVIHRLIIVRTIKRAGVPVKRFTFIHEVLCSNLGYGFPESLQTNVMIVRRIGYDRSHPNHNSSTNKNIVK
jgi:hypothetical protein